MGTEKLHGSPQESESPGHRLGGTLLLCLVAMLTAVHLPGGQEAPELAKSTQALFQGNYEQAQTLARDYLKDHPDFPKAWILLARAEIAQGKHTDAFQHLRKALEFDPTNLDALYYLGRVSALLSQIEYQRLYSIAPDSARVHQLMAESFQAQHNRAKAEEEYKAALEANPKSLEVLDALGDLERSEYRLDEAAAYYSRAAELMPHDYTSAYGLGACALFQHQPQRAIARFRRALEIDPSSAGARLALGDALLQANQPAAATAELTAALTLEPTMRQAYTLLARAYQKLGKSREAQEAFKKEQQLAQQDIESREKTLGSADPVPASGLQGQAP